MTTKFTAIFDGKALLPETPIDLDIDQRYEVTIAMKDSIAPVTNAWDVLDELAGTLEMPEDWSEEHDHYIHGTPKRAGRANP